MNNFWQKITKPIKVMAPMADVTDFAFRYLISQKSKMGTEFGGPNVMWTEFVSVNGLLSEGKEELLRDLQYHENERPIVAQLFGNNPENFFQISKLVKELGHDGIDINMGCPDDNVCKQGAGSALIKNPDLAKEIILACKEGGQNLPVSVKTRIGWNKDETETWIRSILETNPSCLTIHARTKKDMSKSVPNWEAVKRAVEIKNEINPEIIILANGSIRTKTDIKNVIDFTGCDGVMMGKAIFGNPWLFLEEEKNHTVQERLETMLEHTKLYIDLLGEAGPGTNNPNFIFGDKKIPITKNLKAKPLVIMKKHFKAYCHGFFGAKELRIKLMEKENYLEIKNEINDWLLNNQEIANSYPNEEYIA